MYNKSVGINNFANQKQGGESMSKELFVRAEEVAGVLGISKPYAYKAHGMRPFTLRTGQGKRKRR